MDGLVGQGCVDHHAESPLVLGVGGEAHAPGPVGGAPAHSHEHRHVGDVDDGLGDAGLGGEGVDGDDGVCVHVFDDGHVGGKDQGLDPPAEDADAGTLGDAGGHLDLVIAQGPAVGWYVLLHSVLLSPLGWMLLDSIPYLPGRIKAVEGRLVLVRLGSSDRK